MTRKRLVAAVTAAALAPLAFFRGLASASDTVSDIPGLMDQMWSVLLQTTISGKQYLNRGQPDTGKWGDAKALRDRVKAAAGQPAPPPSPQPPPPTVSISSPADGATVSGSITVAGTATG